MLNDGLTAKRLELLSELVPRAGVIALLVNPNNANTERVIRDVLAPRLSFRLIQKLWGRID